MNHLARKHRVTAARFAAMHGQATNISRRSTRNRGVGGGGGQGGHVHPNIPPPISKLLRDPSSTMNKLNLIAPTQLVVSSLIFTLLSLRSWCIRLMFAQSINDHIFLFEQRIVCFRLQHATMTIHFSKAKVEF